MQESPFNGCEQEPIRHLGKVQSHGYFLAVDEATLTIRYVSANFPDTPVPGRLLADFQPGDLPAGRLKDILLSIVSAPEALYPESLMFNGTKYHVVVHRQEGLWIMELEPEETSVSHARLQHLMGQVMADFQQTTSLPELLNKVAVKVRQMTGYDRVMIYRFDEEWNGEVVAETKEDHLEPFLGLHYPASDIPKQARDLYLINLVRIIADVDATPAAILSAPMDPAPDLTHSILRAVSPVHIEYLKNMGVRSSMSFSLLYKGRLWGLISCHHYQSARLVDYDARMAGKVVSQLLSAALEFRHDEQEYAAVARAEATLHTLRQNMQENWNRVEGLTTRPVTALHLFRAGGFACLAEGDIQTLGNVPERPFLEALTAWLPSQLANGIFRTHQLARFFPAAADHPATAAGLLAVRVSAEEYLLWFRPETLQQVSWGGNPEKPVMVDDNGIQRLEPRKSFAKWTQLVHGKADPWHPADERLALRLKDEVLQVAAQRAAQLQHLHRQLQLAYEELDTFSYTVSHDLRVPLASIKTYAEILLEDYDDRLDAETRPIFEKIVGASSRMGELIRQILHYARTSRAELSPEPVGMKSILESVREELLVTEKAAAIDIGDTPPINGDRIMIQQVFSNLLSNAIKYSRTVTNAPIRVEGVRLGNEVRYSVTDHGIGIDRKDGHHIFELFRRLDNAKNVEGHGVGLAIVKRIMQRHNGNVWFRSEPLQETTFFVSFPTT
jgi:chemotaxis family two-component system sensor kinase Cph1